MSAIQKDIELATELAVSIIFGAAAKVSKKVKLEANELTAVGEAIGLLAFVTIRADGTSILTSFSKPQYSEEEPTLVAGRRRRMRGGAPTILTLLLGALGVLFAATTGSNIVMSKAELDEVVRSATLQINAACPLELQLGPPVQSLIDWRGENARAIRTFKATQATCDAVKIAQRARIEAAQTEVQNLVSLIPDRVAVLSTAASILSAGPAGVTPAGLTSASVVGTAMRQVAQAAISGSLPKDLTAFAKDLSKAFPVAEAEAEAAAARGATGGRARTGGRKTKKRAPKRRITRRRPTFVY